MEPGRPRPAMQNRRHSSNQNELYARLSENWQELFELGTHCFWSLRLSRDVFPARRSSYVNRRKLVNF